MAPIRTAAAAWLKANPDVVAPWLEGVTTFDGGDGAAAVSGALGGWTPALVGCGSTMEWLTSY